MKFINRITFLFLMASISHLPVAIGQGAEETSLINATLLENSSMTINGSSTLHDWEVEAGDYTVLFKIPGDWFTSENSWAGGDVRELTVTVPVEKLDGGKNKMNRDLREALRYEDYPVIRFIWDEITFTGVTDTGRAAEVSGRVMIAGVERKTELSVNLGINEWSQIVAAGSVELNMREFDIDPPTAFFGVIRTDEIVDLNFELFFGRS